MSISFSIGKIFKRCGFFDSNSKWVIGAFLPPRVAQPPGGAVAGYPNAVR